MLDYCRPTRTLTLVSFLLALIALLGSYGPTLYHNATRQARWEEFLASADPATRSSVLEWDVLLLKRIQRGGGDIKLLSRVGTGEAGFIEWSPGP